MRQSITLRLFAAIAALLIVGGAGTWQFAHRYGQRAAERAYDMLLEGAAIEIERSLYVTDGKPRADIPISAFELLSLARDDRVVYGVFGPDGSLITGSAALAGLAQPKDGSRFAYADYKGERIRLITGSRMFWEPNFRGAVQVVVGHSLRARDALAREIISHALSIVVIAGSFMFGIAMLAVRVSLAPLKRIERELLRRDPTDLDPIQVRVPVEVRANVQAINRFMGRLSKRVDAMQALIADASHQLLTPLTALSAYAQTAAPQFDRAGRAIADEITHRAKEISHLARQLIDQAMVIHRADAAPLRPVDLRELAMRVERAAAIHFNTSAGQIWLVLPERPAMVKGDDFSLNEAIKNLVANAFRYGRPPVRLVVERRGDGATWGIFVEDCGPGIPEDRWLQVGQRFGGRGTSAASNGLGLSIAVSVAEAHDGRLVIERESGGRFRCGLVLPRLQQPAIERGPR